MGQACWSYNSLYCKQKCSYPNDNCYWISQAKYTGRSYIPFSMTKEYPDEISQIEKLKELETYLKDLEKEN
jgi:hypothetical protein